jgi:hypothetical protein
MKSALSRRLASASAGASRLPHDPQAAGISQIRPHGCTLVGEAEVRSKGARVFAGSNTSSRLSGGARRALGAVRSVMLVGSVLGRALTSEGHTSAAPRCGLDHGHAA